MKRMAEIEIAGKTYPLNFSMRVVRLIGERYGGVDEMMVALDDMTVQDQLTTLFWLLEQMIEQGAAYRRVFEGVESPPTLTAEHLEVYYSVDNASELYSTITTAMSVRTQTEVKTEVDEKNAQTTQSG